MAVISLDFSSVACCLWLSVGRTDMRRGMNGLSLQVQETLGRDPFAHGFSRSLAPMLRRQSLGDRSLTTVMFHADWGFDAGIPYTEGAGED